MTYPTITVTATPQVFTHEVTAYSLYLIEDPFVYSDSSIKVHYTLVDTALGSTYDASMFTVEITDPQGISISVLASSNDVAGIYTLNLKVRYSSTDPSISDAQTNIVLTITPREDDVEINPVCESIMVSPI